MNKATRIVNQAVQQQKFIREHGSSRHGYYQHYAYEIAHGIYTHTEVDGIRDADLARLDRILNERS